MSPGFDLTHQSMNCSIIVRPAGVLPSLVIVADSAGSRDTARVGVGEVTGAGSTAGVIQSRVGMTGVTFVQESGIGVGDGCGHECECECWVVFITVRGVGLSILLIKVFGGSLLLVGGSGMEGGTGEGGKGGCGGVFLKKLVKESLLSWLSSSRTNVKVAFLSTFRIGADVGVPKREKARLISCE